MKFYNSEICVNEPDYTPDGYHMCPCKDKPSVHLRVLSNFCRTKCTNFISAGYDDNNSWIDCKYFRTILRKEKLEQLNNEILQ